MGVAIRRRLATLVLLLVDLCVVVVSAGIFAESVREGHSIGYLVGNLVGFALVLAIAHSLSGAFLAGLFGIEDTYDDGGMEFLFYLRRLYDDLSAVRSRDGRTGDDGSVAGDDEVAEVLRSADALVSDGDADRKAGEFESAVAAYRDAIDAYESATERLTDADRVATVDERIAEIRATLEATRDRRGLVGTVLDPLSDAERSMQRAIAQHVRGELTPARRDYRQAGDHYDRALAAIDDSESDVFDEETGVTVSAGLDGESLSERLTTWQTLSDSDVETLSEAGIGTVTDLRDVPESEIAALTETGRIDATLADRLRAARWWRGEGDRTFTTRAAIERQRDRATDGQQMLS